MESVRKYNEKLQIGDFTLDNNLLIIAGPCSIEDEEQMEEVAKMLIKYNIKFM